ncbi:MAG: CHAT domain-containing protein [Nitrospira sp.]|nr:MAG: CHAT domain-containing protein [Nitrospira sp.]
MAEIRRLSGLTITVPNTFDVVSPKPIAERSRPDRAPGSRRPSTVPMSTENCPPGESASILEALEKQDMQLVDAVDLEPRLEPTPPSGVRRRGAPAIPTKQAVKVVVDVQPTDEVVMLVEQDGMYSWIFPNKNVDVSVPRSRRGASARAGCRHVTFLINVHATSTSKSRDSRRGLFTDLIYSRIKALVLKFAARIVIGQAMKFLERKVSRGLVLIDSENPELWRRVEDISSVPLPQDRSPRILLLLHGTFSSTTGSFGALGGTPWGRAFLIGALANYDAVIGFDHQTLSEDPLENAVDLLTRLQRTQRLHAPQFDAVAFSRGALVFRSLVEHLLPAANWPARFERAVFVGCTNGGTALAEPDNWHALIDLYTNLATGVVRLLGMMPQAAPVAKILSELMQGVGVLAKYMATEAVTASGVPGLAAMEPDGDFVTKLNQTQPGQPMPDKTWYFAVTSEFEAHVLDGDHEPRELPRRLVLGLADGFVDQLMKNAPNDLVVDTPSMTKIDPHVGQFIRDTLDFGVTPQVYHLNYFTRPEVINALTRWLRFTSPADASVPQSNKLRKGSSTTRPVRQALSSGIQGTEVPAVVDTDVLVTDVAISVDEAIAEVRKQRPDYVVLRRPYQGAILNYALQTESLLTRLVGHPPTRSLREALDLHEYQQAKTRSVSSVRAGATSPAVGHIEVVLAGGEPVGVLLPKTALPDATQLVEMARRTLERQPTAASIVVFRPPPLLGRGGPGDPGSGIESHSARTRSAQRPVPKLRGKRMMKSAIKRHVREMRTSPSVGSRPSVVPPTVKCHFRAEMEEEVLLKRVTTLEVDVSREAIGDIQHAAAMEAAGEADPTRKLIIQVIPKRNFEMASENDRAEIELPEPNKPQSLYFDIRATHDNDGEGELWVVARQGQVPLVRLTLRPRIVTKRSASVRRTTSMATAAEAQPLAEPLTQLYITEQLNGNTLRYHFQLQNPTLGILVWDLSKPIRGSREQYVKKLYGEIESRWVSSAGDIESFYEELRAYGAELFDELVPARVQQVLWQHRNKIDSIMVIAEEPFIPWEVVHLVEPDKPLAKGTPFFGEMGLVRWLEEASWPRETIPLGAGRARFVIPDYPHPDYKLPETAEEAKFLKRIFAATAVEPVHASVRKLLSTPGAFDLLHFACHGEAEQEDRANAALMLQGRVEGGKYIPDYFNATTAEYHSNFHRDGQPGPMIVLNACQVGRASYKLTGNGGFARAFLRRGASVFVGTLWSVGDAPARTFTEEFYTRLMNHKACIADATKAARAKARDAGDATWLAYVVYGHPHARVG